MRVSLLVVVALSAWFASACGPAPEKRLHVTREQYGDDWPFTTEEGWLECHGRSVVIYTAGQYYALNGKALQAMDLRGEYLDLVEIVNERNPLPASKIGKLIERGLTLCEN